MIVSQTILRKPMQWHGLGLLDRLDFKPRRVIVFDGDTENRSPEASVSGDKEKK
jgi:hypothetical protein